MTVGGPTVAKTAHLRDVGYAGRGGSLVEVQVDGPRGELREGRGGQLGHEVVDAGHPGLVGPPEELRRGRGNVHPGDRVDDLGRLSRRRMRVGGGWGKGDTKQSIYCRLIR